ncbi:zinc metalloprotease [Nibrella viscosa]|uniref:Zinc metalloprotease n=2 Tax=Nibrella viscosa TaxID=1084524 RepID=A0ABP8KPN1_9BACT
MKVWEEKVKENPGLLRKMQEIEEHTQRFAAQKGNSKPGGGGGGPVSTTATITIPVYVHVVSNVNKPEEDISDAQIQSQIAVLNADFQKLNSDASQTPAEFASRVANFNIQFVLARTIRKSSTKTQWGTNDAVKSTKRGGSDPINPETSLNIWVCNIGGGILGYAQFPGGSLATDGVVVGPQYFGSSAVSNNFYLEAPYDKGRTATHEIGHWLNLRHIWGDGGCGVDDFVADTPLAGGPNYRCPGYPTVGCGNNMMTMNYMDYTYDACMYMFTEGQKTRARAVFASGGPRSSFVTTP